MATQFNSSDDEVISAINITPLVDVVLVLLIIFMITAPVIYQASIKVHLAKASSGEEVSERPELNIAVTKSGELIWNNETIGWPALDQRLKDLGEKASQKTAIISADRETPHGVVMQLVDTLRRTGLTHLTFNVEKVPK